MFIDYLSLMLVNTASGFFVLAGFLARGEEEPQEAWAPAFALVGLISLVTGFWMTFSWPLPGSYNITFGELSVLFGGLMFAASWALAKGLDLKPLACYGFFAGLAAVIAGLQFLRLGLSQTPLLAGTGFLLAGVAGLGAYPAIKSGRRSFRLAGAVTLVFSGLIWTYLACSAFWYHIEGFMKR